MRRMIIAAIASLALLVGAMPSEADAAASGWKIYSYNPSGRALSSKQAPAGTDSIAQFDVLPTPDDALLAMKATANRSILGMTITATFRIEGAGTFTYYGEGTPSNPCGTPANVRLYFNTANGPFAYTKYWWSNPAAAVLTAPSAGTVTVTAAVDAANWSDWGGEPGATQVGGFNDAASNPDLIGLSFGGGCFFENGVGMSTGSATFILESYTIR